MTPAVTTAIDELFATPAAPHSRVDWAALDARFAWIRAMRGVEQDPVWHAEGDVWIHTRLVCEALAASPAWQALDTRHRRICWLGALFHDIAKPYSTKHEGGRVRSPHHSPRGAVHARRLLWEAGLPAPEREQVCGLVRHHQLPLVGLAGDDVDRRASAASLRCRLRDLAIVAEADIRGRECDDQPGKLESIELFGELARELGCWDAPRPFPNEHTRVLYFRRKRAATDEAYDDHRLTVTLLSGLPASGKSHWRVTQRPELPVICLDDLRDELGVDPAADQGRVRQLAQERARELLRRGRDFVWDATNLDASRRNKLIELFLAYRARVVVVAVESPPATLWHHNAGRPRTLPRHVIESMLTRWVPPDATEAHDLQHVTAT